MKSGSLLKRALIRIVPVSLAVGLVAATAGYWHAQRIAEESDIRVLTMEARHAVSDEILELPANVRQSALSAALKNMVGGGFAIAAVYSPTHKSIAEAVQPGFEGVAAVLGAMAHPSIASLGSYDTAVVSGQNVLRVFVPLALRDGQVVGHLEGVRVISVLELSAFRQAAIESASIAALSVLLCTAVLAPLLTGLAARNLKWAHVMTEAHIGILEAMGRAIAKRDCDTGIHNYRVTWIAARLGEKAELDAQQLRSLIAGSFLHDIGKIGIPDSILLKPAKLDDQERAIMQTHVEIGGQIAGSVGFLRHAREVIEGHHEKWDGTGYPKHRAGYAIPLNARIFCIADVYDALRAKRPYKDPFSFEKSMAIMRDGKSTHFDPLLFDLFEKIVDEIEAKIFNTDEGQLIDLTRKMARKNFFSDVKDDPEE